ncbi:MAG: fibro-slime domain-containing protein, partial [Clostridia bacterium]|nr:fibro-slime domain-containing protein [Clostridia bacterium]
MKIRNKSKRVLSMFLVLAMVMTMLPLTVSAATVGTLEAGETGLDTDINTEDTISLPIKIYDYLNDGMLFEYAETQGSANVNQWMRAENVSKPTFTIGVDYTLGKTSYSGVKWAGRSYTSGSATVGNTASLTYLNWNRTTAACAVDFSIDGTSSSSYAKDSMQYMVLVYRSNGGSNGETAGVYVNADNSTDGGVGGKFYTTFEYDNRKTSWKYVVVDLSSMSGWKDINKIYGVYPYFPNISSIGIAYIAFFSSNTAACEFGASALEYTGETYHYTGDNRAFGLLRYSRTTAYGSNTTDDNIGTAKSSAGIHMLNSYGDVGEIDVSTYDFGYDYKLQGTFGALGIATAGMLECELKNGLPYYKQATIEYVAEILQGALTIPEIDSSTGYKNYQFVKGTADDRYGNIDLAQWLRNHCASLGTYSATSKKSLIGTWDTVRDNITTYMDAAYFLLNNIFVDNSYNDVMDDYDYLVLSSATDSDGKKVYIFDGGFATSATPASATSAVVYDEDENTIQNSSAAGKTMYYYEEDNSNTTTYYPLLPIVNEKGNNTNGVTESPYFLDPGVTSTTSGGNTYVNRNYNYAIASEGEFVYHADDELFFTFEGYDDVYLFIDGKLVLDIGGAHSITNVTMNVNDYADILGLVDGDTYAFNFYYMERHGVGANMCIETNIRVTDPTMNVEKTAYVDGTQIDFGSVVNKDGVVEYGFSLTNKSEVNLYNYTFTDNDIGVVIGYDNGLKITGSNVCDTSGGTLEVTDLKAVVTDNNGNETYYTFSDSTQLKQFLTDLTGATQVSRESTEELHGLANGWTIQIRGIGYKLTKAQQDKGVFNNIVYATATNSNGSKKLQGQDNMRVFVPADPMYYQWANHKLEIPVEKLVEDVNAAANQENNFLYGTSGLTSDNVKKIEITTRNGYATTNENVIIGGTSATSNITVNYKVTGSHVFYLKLTYGSSSQTVVVPVLVNVTDVADSVYVLDYGLSVDLTAGGELVKNDTLTVPGRSTNTTILGIGSNGAYSPNEITFTSSNNVETKAGDFTIDGQTIMFTPDAFMEDIYSAQVAVNVYEVGTTPSEIDGELNINKEVEMYKNIHVLPANVVYYEDDFAAVDKKTDGTSNEFEKIGSSSDKTQSNDQTQNYGQDKAYQNNSDTSAGTITTVTIKESGEVATFTFTGTGFEIISRTNAYDSATMTVKVTQNGETVKNIPVITEFDNGANGDTEEIYQVPVIRVDDLTYGTYTVAISGVPARDYNTLDANGEPTIIPTKLYIDGIRIFNPMEEKDTDGYYLVTEQGAQFVEIRDQILNGYIAAVTYDGATMTLGTATTTWTEQYVDETYEDSATTGDNNTKIYKANQVDSINEYLMEGPNNEVYMSGNSLDSALAFYVTKTSGATVNNLQIAVHAVDEGLFYGAGSTGMNAEITFGVLGSDGSFAWQPLTTVTSGTEQYYTIDLAKCYTDNDGRIQVVVKVNSGMASFTSLKLNGLTLGNIGGDAT